MKHSYTFYLIIFFTFLLHGSALSIQINWTGNGNSQFWSDSGNWDCGCLPGISDDVFINGGGQGVYVNFNQFDVIVNSITLQNAELELQYNLEIVDDANIDEQSTIIFTYFSSNQYTILAVQNLNFYGTVNVRYNNVPEDGGTLDLFDFDIVETDCESNIESVGMGDGFLVYQELYCEFDDFGPLYIMYIENEISTVSWTGEIDNLWHNPGNWSPTMVPGINNIAIVNGYGDVVAMQKINAKKVLIGVDCTLEINDGLESEFHSWIDEYASITWKGGDLSRSNSSQQNIIFNYGEFNIETSSMKMMKNGLILEIIGPMGTLKIKENVQLTTDGLSNILRNLGGNIIIEGDGQNIFFDEIINDGTINKSTGSGESRLLAAEGAFVNYNNVMSSSGILIIGANFDNLGRLSGTGAFDFEYANGTPETLNGGITPGNSPGALTFMSGPELQSSNFVIELQGVNPGTHHDQLMVLDDIKIGSIMNVQKPSWYNPQEGDQYKIITSTGNITGTFSHIVYPDMSGNWTISYNAQDIIVSYGASVPVELVDIIVSKEEQGNLLNWATASEVNSQDFLIEMSNNSLNWHVIGKELCKGNETSGSLYQFLHRVDNAGIFYYRLKMQDLDGQFEYSKIVSLRRDYRSSETFTIYPNPATKILNIFINLGEIWAGTDAKIINNIGETVKVLELRRDFEAMNISNLDNGLYFLVIRQKNGKVTTRKFSKI